MTDFRKPEDITSVELLDEEIGKVMLLVDEGVVRMVAACAIGNKLNLSPIWMMLVAPSSGGKSYLISAISSLEYVHAISDLTVNTFASGQSRPGKETSLLLKLNNGIMVFKDFTSIISKNKEARREIMGQMREIYDGEYTKRTGNARDVAWRGKVGALAGCTEIIYRNSEEMAAMGDRFIMYSMEQPDRLEVARLALKNSAKKGDLTDHMKRCFVEYIKKVQAYVEENDSYEVDLKDDVREELLLVADFATRARSAVLTNFKSGLVEFVPSAEMPMRVTEQLFTLASTFLVMNLANPDLAEDHPARLGQLTALEQRIICKTAYDSIPRTRRDVIIPLTKYRKGCTTAGLATTLDLPTDTVRKYLTEITALGIGTRHKSGGAQGDTWKLKEEYRKIVKSVVPMRVIEEQILQGSTEASGDPWAQIEDEEEMQTLDIFEEEQTDV